MTPIENLSPNNFLSICDIAIDIKEKLQMSTKNVIILPLLRQPYISHGQVFNILIPSKDYNSLNNYCNRRIKAIEYLKENKVLENFELQDGELYPVSLMNSEVEISVNNAEFDKFYRRLGEVYQKRIVDPAIKEQEKLKNTPHTTSTDGWEKLKVFREKIDKAVVFDDNFKQLIGVEIFALIQANSAIKNEFDRRFNYFGFLANDAHFIDLQNSLIRSVIMVLSLFDLDRIKKLQAEYPEPFFNRINIPQKDTLTLTELYSALSNEQSYHKIDRVHAKPQFDNQEGAFTFYRDIVQKVRDQYGQIDFLFNNFLHRAVSPQEHDLAEAYTKAINHYNDQWYPFDELIYLKPIQLHIKEFEDFFVFCISIYPRKGYEWWYEFHRQLQTYDLKQIKSYSLAVIDDLIDAISTNHPRQKQIKPLDAILYGNAKTRALYKKRYGDPYERIDELEEKIKKISPSVQKNEEASIDKFTVSVRDREIRVNEYLVSKPHAVGNNFDFFDYVRNQPANTKIEWATIPDTIAWEMMKKAIHGRRFIQILHALGFKGEIKKAFFYKVGTDTLYYRGDEITKQDLEKCGVKIPLFLKELEVAHTKNSPE